MMRSLHERLRLHHSKDKNQKPAEVERQIPDPKRESLPLGFSWRSNQQGSYLFRRRVYPLDFGEGRYQLRDLVDVGLEAIDLIADVPVGVRKLEELLFFDTETTGLGTGAGNLIFLFGVGYFRDGSFVLEHYFLPDVSHEPALLTDLAERIQTFGVLVTYNGKGFDWAQLKTRLTLNRLSRDMDPAHCDLLYPARRLWSDVLPSCRMQEVESSCLGLLRQNDVPGHQAPAFYFDYLQKGGLTALDGVLCHNERDILSLVYLFTHIQRLLIGDGTPQFAEEKLAVGKWWMVRDRERAGDWLQAVIRDPSASLKTRREAFRLISAVLKREGDWKTATDLWHEWLEQDPWNAEPCVELAKYYEHRTREVGRAYDWTQQAIHRLKRKRRFGSPLRGDREMKALTDRAQRLEAKRKKSLF
ncbi:ribonuclease H-like domain-containing protein [Paludifilum halophilum]|uniref:YprB ribonuclease H-like domain-containing protein n=1 Tax=Paludifilum halophilum TaxID=1642702 RepID=A0A235BC43_9BACL|nr:ribonuclease H-like domain-containing protein [Paludifilum halophilum]OYD09858.1 hypothetical protein CHM34_02410 [Paludifilum halophilum]